ASAIHPVLHPFPTRRSSDLLGFPPLQGEDNHTPSLRLTCSTSAPRCATMQAWRPAIAVARFRVRELSSRANVSARAANLTAWLSVGVSFGLAVPALGMAARTYPSTSGLLSSPSA